MFLPFRAKNPPERFPYATLSLIGLNVLVFLCTIDHDWQIRESVLAHWGVSHHTLNPVRLITAMFLHGSILHIAGNMLFLWIFGASVEGRLGWWKFLLVYFTAGLCGGLLHDVVVGINHPDMMSLGASGAIMGIAGAYLYLFPYSIICVFRWWYFRIGVVEWQARWIVLMYVGLDVVEALLSRGMDGVGHMAHIGGFATGLLFVYLLRARRDTEDYSSAQASRTGTRDLTQLPIYELEALINRPDPEPGTVLAYCEKSLISPGGETKCVTALQQHGRLLIERADAVRLANVLLRVAPYMAKGLPSIFFLRLGSRLEAGASNEAAISVYYRLGEVNAASSDFEVALSRLARIAANVYNDQAQAAGFYQEMLRLFPNGTMAAEAKMALAGLPNRSFAAGI